MRWRDAFLAALLRQASLYADPASRLRVAVDIYDPASGKRLPDGTTLQQSSNSGELSRWMLEPETGAFVAQFPRSFGTSSGRRACGAMRGGAGFGILDEH